ncbi:hypothetical protein [Candidatus Nitrosoglobus terrae]|uniref:hypothetical protein n=1 Tax=Candidatus Nitrosoglobus terrae TaxID=1630141 RepID=UPI000BBA83A6|nr:hypothetical protein [Candidatus Nitrosoglobus terrae]
MTWSPDLGDIRKLQPKSTFFVNTGSFGSNNLAKWTDVGRNAATIFVPDSFDADNNCTVTYTPTGGFEVKKGKPESTLLETSTNLYSSLIQSHLLLCNAHGKLIETVSSTLTITDITGDNCTMDELVSVTYDTQQSSIFGDTSLTYLSGTITVKTALAASFAFLALGGVAFSVQGTLGNNTFKFSYTGDKPLQVLKELIIKGAQLCFTNRI